MDIHSLRKVLEKQERVVFSLNDLSKITGQSKKIMTVYVNRMCKKNLLFKIKKNSYSISDDVFVVASQLYFPSYLGLSTSLYLNNILSQVVDKIYVVYPRQKKKLKIFGTEIVFFKLNPKLLFGYKKIKKEDSFIFISDIEKTLIDYLLLNNKLDVELIKDILVKSDILKLEEYLKKINKEHLVRKVGYFLDLLKIKHNLKPLTKTIYFINKSKNKKFIKEWGLYV